MNVRVNSNVPNTNQSFVNNMSFIQGWGFLGTSPCPFPSRESGLMVPSSDRGFTIILPLSKPGMMFYGYHQHHSQISHRQVLSESGAALAVCIGPGSLGLTLLLR